MLQETAHTEEDLGKLELIMQQNASILKLLDVFNARFVGFERTVRINTSRVQETLTYVKRLQPYIKQAMGALHNAFKMVCNGILNLREEQSEFAGNCLDEQNDRIHIV